MVVRTQTPELRSTRQAVLSLILSYHSDRCLTCHRIVKCKPGDTCLRDDTVTHRCLTCSKNYRCELQTTCEMLEMAGYEPWDGDKRTYYNLPQPPADQANPFLEFDPQMCIICTRCVRACDEIRHTGAITLAGRGFSTRIAFGDRRRRARLELRLLRRLHRRLPDGDADGAPEQVERHPDRTLDADDLHAVLRRLLDPPRDEARARASSSSRTRTPTPSAATRSACAAASTTTRSSRASVWARR